MDQTHRRSLRRVYVLLTLFSASMLAGMFVVLRIGTRVGAEHGVLVDTAREIQTSLAVAHWQGEALRLAQERDGERRVRRTFEKAEACARAMLDGGRIESGVIPPLEEPPMRASVRAIERGIAELKTVALERLDGRREQTRDAESAAGRYTTLHQEVLDRAASLRDELHKTSNAELQRFQRFQFGLMGGFLGVSVLAFLAFTRHIRQFARDMSERKQADAALRVSEQRFRDIAEAAGEYVWEVDAEWNHTFITERCTTVLGREPKALLGQTMLTIMHPDEAVRLRPVLDEVWAQGRTFRDLDCRCRGAEGEERWVRLSGMPVRDGRGKVIGYRGTGLDITGQHDAQRRLLQSEEKYRGLFESTADAMMVLTEEEFIDCNAATVEMFGCASATEFLGRHPSEYSPPKQKDGADSHEAAQGRIRQAVERGAHRFEWLHHRKDGTPFEAEVVLNATEWEGRRVLYAVVRDITERKRTEQELREKTLLLEAKKTEIEAQWGQLKAQQGELIRANERLAAAKVAAEAANRAKSEFLANMSHEIRTPMTAILGFADVLTDADLSEEERRTALGTIRQNGKHLLDIINDILDLSKIESGRLDAKAEPCCPRGLVEELVAAMEVRAEEKGLSLRHEVQGSVPELIQSDPVRLRQILLNLLGNAIKFTEEGEVTVTCGFLRGSAVLNVPQVEPRIQFRVADTGIGIPRDQLDNLFQPFHQGDSSLTRRFGGTGLGLTISRRLAQVLGGDIEVESEVGRGSVFTLTITAEPVTVNALE